MRTLIGQRAERLWRISRQELFTVGDGASPAQSNGEIELQMSPHEGLTCCNDNIAATMALGELNPTQTEKE
jgi:hypothetical protein